MTGWRRIAHNAHARSIELDVLVEGVSLATELTRQWQGLVDSGLVVAAHR